MYMAQKFKVGDLVYCTKLKMFGFVHKIFDGGSPIGIYFNVDIDYNPSVNSMFKVSKINAELLLDFANYCISEGFTSNATNRDLVRFLNSRKEVNYES